MNLEKEVCRRPLSPRQQAGRSQPRHPCAPEAADRTNLDRSRV